MTANRSRKQHKEYATYNKARKSENVCVFCELDKKDPQVIRETKYFWLVYNIFPYSVWDDMKVLDHLMLVPKKHTDTLASLSKEASVEYVKLISEFESQGYGVWARGVGSAAKSIIHQHTHFIKGDGKRGKFVFHTYKPYTRIHI